ncbi:hypothetical protein SCG7086_AB_00140 [Chlamydiales bacterium SCGC AG-110-P3]|nr:hypothetical protein SCG7086_AB_00140 [Chlamydiales bacterium SCGC AG-110-P3]
MVFEHAHFVFVAKYRGSVFTKQLLDRLEVILSEIGAQMNAELLEVNGKMDHAHLLVNWPPK